MRVSTSERLQQPVRNRDPRFVGSSPFSLPDPIVVPFGERRRALIVPREDSPLVTVLARFPRGSLTDPKGKEGLTELCTRMLAEGCEGLARRALAEALDRMGAALDLDSDHETTDVSLELRPEDLASGIPLLARVLRSSVFPEKERTKIVRQMIAELRSIEEHQASIAKRAFRSLLYDRADYGRPILGTAESLKSITRDDLLSHQRRLLDPESLLLIICGSRPDRDLKPILESAFSSWETVGPAPDLVPEIPVPLEAGFSGPAVALIDRPEFHQVDVLVGFPGPRFMDPNRIPLRVANSILGGASSSRLFQRQRAEKGLSYDLGSSLTTRYRAGEISISGATRQSSVLELLGDILDVVEEIREEPLTEKEIGRAKALIRTDVAAGTETAEDIAFLTAERLQLGLPGTFLSGAMEKLETLDGETIRRAWRSACSPAHRLIVLVGPVRDLAPQIDRFGRVLRIDRDRQVDQV